MFAPTAAHRIRTIDLCAKVTRVSAAATKPTASATLIPSDVAAGVMSDVSEPRVAGSKP